MSRLDDFESIITGGGTRSISGIDPVDPWVLKVVAHSGFADESYAQEEFDVLERIMPDQDVGEIMEFMVAESERPLDLQALKAGANVRARAQSPVRCPNSRATRTVCPHLARENRHSTARQERKPSCLGQR